MLVVLFSPCVRVTATDRGTCEIVPTELRVSSPESPWRAVGAYAVIILLYLVAMKVAQGC